MFSDSRSFGKKSKAKRRDPRCGQKGHAAGGQQALLFGQTFQIRLQALPICDRRNLHLRPPL